MNKTILKYHVVEMDVLEEFISEVNEHITAGWEPVGGITISTKSEGENDGLIVTYLQAMVM